METADPTPHDEITATLERPAVAEVAELELIPAEELQPIPAAPSAADDLPADDLSELRA